MSGTQNPRMYGDVKGDGQMNSISSLDYLQKMEQKYEQINDDRRAFGRKVKRVRGEEPEISWDRHAETDTEFAEDLKVYKKNVTEYESFLMNDLEYAFPYGVYDEMVAGCYIAPGDDYDLSPEEGKTNSPISQRGNNTPGSTAAKKAVIVTNFDIIKDMWRQQNGYAYNWYIPREWRKLEDKVREAAFSPSVLEGGWQGPKSDAEKVAYEQKKSDLDIPVYTGKQDNFFVLTKPSSASDDPPVLLVNLANKFKSRIGNKLGNTGIYKYMDMNFSLGTTPEEARKSRNSNNTVFSTLLEKNVNDGIYRFNLYQDGTNVISPQYAGNYIAFHVNVYADYSSVSNKNWQEWPKASYVDENAFVIAIPQNSEQVAIKTVDQTQTVAAKKDTITKITQRLTVERAFNLGLFETIEEFFLPRCYNLVMENYGIPKGSGIYEGIDFRGGDFEGADLTNCQFINCHFEGANLHGTTIKNTSFRGSTYDKDTIFPLGFGSKDVHPNFYTENFNNSATESEWKPWSEYKESMGDHLERVDGEVDINIGMSVSNNAGFRAVWGSPWVDNATENVNYISSNDKMLVWFTIEQAFRQNAGPVTVSPLLQFLALKNGSRTERYKYFFDREKLESDEFIDFGVGGLSSRIIKSIHFYKENNEDNDVRLSDPIVITALDVIDNNEPEEVGAERFALPNDIKYNILFGTEVLRDLNAPENEKLLNLGNPFLQLGRDIVPSINEYIQQHDVPYFRRKPYGAGEDHFICCGRRWLKGLKSARNINFEGANFNGREWEWEKNYLPDSVDTFSTRLYPAIFAGKQNEFLDLTNTSFKGADLRNVVFMYCDLTNVNFDGCKLNDALFIDNTYGNTNFDNIEAKVLGIDADVGGALQYGPTKRKKSTGGIYFVNTTKFLYDRVEGNWVVDSNSDTVWPKGIENQNSTYDLSASFVGADIRGSRFANIKLNGDFTNVKANWIEFENVEFKPTVLNNSAFKDLYVDNRDIQQFENDEGDNKGTSLFPIGTPPVFLRREDVINDPTPFIMVKYGSTQLMDQDFTVPGEAGLNLSVLKEIKNVKFTNSIMNGVDFSGVKLINCDFRDCSLNNTNWKNTELIGCVLNDSDLVGAKFEESDFKGAEIDGVAYPASTFGGADLTDAKLINCDITGAKFREQIPPDTRRTVLDNTNIYWDQFEGQELLGYDPTSNGNKSAFQSYYENAAGNNFGAWPYGLKAVFQGAIPKNSAKFYDTPAIYFQIVEGNKNINNITELISNAGTYMSKSNNLGYNEDGLNYDDTADTSEPLLLNNFQAIGSNIEGLNFNQCLLTGADFSESTTSSTLGLETKFKNIISELDNTLGYSVSFRDSVLEGHMNFNDAELDYADFTNAKITHPDSEFSVMEEDGREQTVDPNYILDDFGNGIPMVVSLDSDGGNNISNIDVVKDKWGRRLGRGASINYAKFSNSELNVGINFNHAEVTGTQFNNVTGLEGCQDLRYLVSNNIRKGARGSINDIETYRQEIENKWVEVDAKNELVTNFSDTDLSGANLSYSELRMADFTNTDLTGTKMEFCDIRGSRFTNANLTNASFKITGDNQRLENGLWSSEEKALLKGEIIVKRQEFLDNIDIRYAILSNTSFEGYENKHLTKLKWPIGYYTQSENGILSGGLQIDFKGAGTHSNYSKDGDDIGSAGVRAVSGFWKLTAGVLEMPGTDFTYTGSGMSVHAEKSKQHVGYLDWFKSNSDSITADERLASYQKGRSYVQNHWADAGTQKVHRNKDLTQKINASNSVFYNANYEQTSHTFKRLFLTTSTIVNVNFNDSDFRKIHMNSCTFIDCTFNDCDFKGAVIKNCGFDNCEMKHCMFNSLVIQNPDNTTTTYTCQLNENNFIHCNFKETSFKGAKISKMYTSNCDFTSADFEDADLDYMALCKVPEQVHWSVWNKMSDAAKVSKSELKPPSGPNDNGRTFYNEGGNVIDGENGAVRHFLDPESSQVNGLVDTLNAVPTSTLHSYAGGVSNESKQNDQKEFLWRYHSNLREANFKNTKITFMSVDGHTRDLNGVNKNMLPPGFYDKLFNNVPNSESDLSGNNQKYWERVGGLLGAKVTKEFIYWDGTKDISENIQVGWLADITNYTGDGTNHNYPDGTLGRKYVQSINQDGTFNIQNLIDNNYGLRIDGPTNLERLRAGVTTMSNKLFRKVDISHSNIAQMIKETNPMGTEDELRLDLQNSNLSEANLQYVDFSDMIANGANFSGADLTGAVLKNADLRNVEFDGANLTDVDLRGADLTGARFRNAILTGIIISGGVVGNTDLLDDSRNPTQFADYSTGEIAHFDKTKVASASQPETYMKGMRESDNKGLYSEETETITGDVDGFTAVAHWPYGVNIDPSHAAETIKQVEFIENAQFALDKLRGGQLKCGGLDFTTKPTYMDWRPFHKTHFLNPLPAKNIRNINTNFLVEWLPQESNLENGVLEDWNSSSRYESGEASLHRGQWNWSDKNPNYYGFPNITVIGTKNVKLTNGDTILVEIKAPRYDFSTEDGETRTNFSGVTLINSYFPDTNFKNCNFTNAYMNTVQVRNSNFEGAILDGADFGRTPNSAFDPGHNNRSDLTNCSFVNASCLNTCFDDSDLGYADFSGAKLDGATFFNCNLYKADLRFADFGTKGITLLGSGPWTAKTYQDWVVQTSSVSRDSLNASLSHWIPIDRDDSDINAKTFNNVLSNGAWTYYSLSDENSSQKQKDRFQEILPLVPEGFNLMAGMGLTRDLSGRLVNTFLHADTAYHKDDAYKSDATTGVHRDELKVKAPTPGEQLAASYEKTLTNQYTDISGDTIDGQDMSDLVLGTPETKLEFTNSNLNNVDLTDTVLHNASFKDADLNNVNFTNASLVNASFEDVDVMNNITLHGADLTNADFTNVDLSGLDFSNLPNKGLEGNEFNEDLPDNVFALTTNWGQQILSTGGSIQNLSNGDTYDVFKTYNSGDGILEVKKQSGTTNPPINGNYLLNSDLSSWELPTSHGSDIEVNSNLRLVSDVSNTTLASEDIHTVKQKYTVGDGKVVVDSKTDSNDNASTGDYYVDVDHSQLKVSFTNNLDSGVNSLAQGVKLVADNQLSLTNATEHTVSESWTSGDICIGTQSNHSNNIAVGSTYKVNRDMTKLTAVVQSRVNHANGSSSIVSGTKLVKETELSDVNSVEHTVSAGKATVNVSDELDIDAQSNTANNVEAGVSYKVNRDMTKLTVTLTNDTDNSTLADGIKIVKSADLNNANATEYIVRSSVSASAPFVVDVDVIDGSANHVSNISVGKYKLSRNEGCLNATLHATLPSNIDLSSTLIASGPDFENAGLGSNKIHTVKNAANANTSNLIIQSQSNSADNIAPGIYKVNRDTTKKTATLSASIALNANDKLVKVGDISDNSPNESNVSVTHTGTQHTIDAVDANHPSAVNIQPGNYLVNLDKTKVDATVVHADGINSGLKLVKEGDIANANADEHVLSQAYVGGSGNLQVNTHSNGHIVPGDYAINRVLDTKQANVGSKSLSGDIAANTIIIDDLINPTAAKTLTVKSTYDHDNTTNDKLLLKTENGKNYAAGLYYVNKDEYQIQATVKKNGGVPERALSGDLNDGDTLDVSTSTDNSTRQTVSATYDHDNTTDDLVYLDYNALAAVSTDVTYKVNRNLNIKQADAVMGSGTTSVSANARLILSGDRFSTAVGSGHVVNQTLNSNGKILVDLSSAALTAATYYINPNKDKSDAAVAIGPNTSATEIASGKVLSDALSANPTQHTVDSTWNNAANIVLSSATGAEAEIVGNFYVDVDTTKQQAVVTNYTNTQRTIKAANPNDPTPSGAGDKLSNKNSGAANASNEYIVFADYTDTNGSTGGWNNLQIKPTDTDITTGTYYVNKNDSERHITVKANGGNLTLADNTNINGETFYHSNGNTLTIENSDAVVSGGTVPNGIRFKWVDSSNNGSGYAADTVLTLNDNPIVQVGTTSESTVSGTIAAGTTLVLDASKNQASPLELLTTNSWNGQNSQTLKVSKDNSGYTIYNNLTYVVDICRNVYQGTTNHNQNISVTKSISDISGNSAFNLSSEYQSSHAGILFSNNNNAASLTSSSETYYIDVSKERFVTSITHQHVPFADADSAGNYPIAVNDKLRNTSNDTEVQIKQINNSGQTFASIEVAKVDDGDEHEHDNNFSDSDKLSGSYYINRHDEDAISVTIDISHTSFENEGSYDISNALGNTSWAAGQVKYQSDGQGGHNGWVIVQNYDWTVDQYANHNGRKLVLKPQNSHTASFNLMTELRNNTTNVADTDAMEAGAMTTSDLLNQDLDPVKTIDSRDIGDSTYKNYGTFVVSKVVYKNAGSVKLTGVSNDNDGTITVGSGGTLGEPLNDGEITIGAPVFLDSAGETPQTIGITGSDVKSDGQVTLSNIDSKNDGSIKFSAQAYKHDGTITLAGTTTVKNDGILEVNAVKYHHDAEVTVNTVEFKSDMDISINSIDFVNGGEIEVTSVEHKNDGTVKFSSREEKNDGTITVTHRAYKNGGKVTVTGTPDHPNGGGPVVITDILEYNDTTGVHNDAKFKDTIFTGATNATNAKWPVGVDFSIIESGEGEIKLSTPSIAVQLEAGRENFKNIVIEDENLDGLEFGGHSSSYDGVKTSPVLTGATFKNVSLKGTDFSNVDLSGTSFVNVNVEGAIFSNSDIEGAIFTGMVNADKAQWPIGFNYDKAATDISAVSMPSFLEKVRGYPLSSNLTSGQKGVVDIDRGDGVGHPLIDVSKALVDQDLQALDLSGQNLSGLDIAGAKLTGVNLAYTNCTGLNFKDTKLINASIKTGNGIEGVSFFNADLTNADFSGCSVSNCDFRFAKISNTVFTNISNFTSAKWPQGIVVYLNDGEGATSWDYDNQANTIKLIQKQGNWNKKGQSFAFQPATSWSFNVLSQRTPANLTLKDNYGFYDNGNPSGFGSKSTKGNNFIYEKPNAQMTVHRSLPGYDLSNLTAEDVANYFGSNKDSTANSGSFSDGGVGIDLVKANLSNTKLNDIDLRGVNFSETDVSGLTLSESLIYGSVDEPTLFIKTQFGPSGTNADMFQSLYKSVQERLRVKYINAVNSAGANYVANPEDGVEGVNFAYDVSNASWLKFEEVNLSGYNLGGLGLVDCDFKHCNLTGADFKDAVIVDVDFTGSDLTNVDFTGATMHNVNLTNCNINNTKFQNVRDLFGDVVVGVENKYIQGLIMPLGLNYTNERDYTSALLPVSSDFISNTTSYDYSLANNTKRLITGQVFEELSSYNGGNSLYDMTNADLSNVAQTIPGQKYAKWEESDFSGVDMTGANLEASWFSLTDENEGISFVRANMTNANVKDAAFTRTLAGVEREVDMTEIILDGVDMSVIRREVGDDYHKITKKLNGVSAVNTDFSGVQFQNYTDMENADLTGADLTGATLKHASLMGATMVNTDLSACNLFGADLSGVVFDNAELKGTRFADTNLHKVKFKNLTLSEIFASNIGYPDLSGGEFDNVVFAPGVCVAGNLTNVVFKNSHLEGIDFNVIDGRQEADLTGVTFEASCSFKNTDLTNLKLINVEFNSADLSGASGVALQGSDFTNSNLSNTDLNSQNLSNVDLSRTDLTNANLSGANLSGAKNTNELKAENADLSGVDLTGLSLVAANLKNTTLTDVSLNNVDLSGADLTMGTSAKLDALKAQLDGAIGLNLSHATLSVNMPMNSIDLSGVKLMNHMVANGANLSSSMLKGVELQHAKLAGANLNDISGAMVNLNHADLTGASLKNAYLVDSHCVGTNLSNCDLSTANLENVDLKEANLTNANLNGQDLMSIPLMGANLNGADLTDAKINPLQDFSGVSFENANLTNVDLSGIKLDGNSLKNSNLTGVDISGADLSGVDMTGATALGVALSGKVFVQFNKMNLSAANLSGVDFANMATLNHCNFSSSNLTSASFEGKQLVNCNFTGANLINADLSGCVVDASCNFTDANINGINLNGAVIDSVDFSNALDADVKSVNFHAVLNKSLKHVNLSTLVLSGKDLSGIDLTGANLSGCDLTGCDLTDCKLVGADLKNADLTNAVLVNADLTNADMEGCKLNNANMTEADLTGANMKSVDVHSAQFVDVTFSNTIIKDIVNGANATVSGNDKRHAEYANIDGSFSGFRPIINVFTAVDVNGRNLKDLDIGVNSRGHTGAERTDLQA